MSFIKTTNIITTEETTDIIRMVECPYCHTGLKPVPTYITAMKCWHCNKEFRIQQDPKRFKDINQNVVRRTQLRGVLK